jgi:hypothetical protein
VTVLSATACSTSTSDAVFTDDEAQLVVVARLIDMAQTPEAKEYVGILFPSVAEGDFVERHNNLKAYKYIIDKWPSDVSEAFRNALWFDADFDEHFSSFNRPTWVIYDDGRVIPQGGALLVEADIEKLNRDGVLHSQNVYNAYIVSSDLRTTPIVNSKTGLTVGQAYNGFAVQSDYVKDGKAYFTINISDPSVPNSLKTMEFYIPVAHMEKAYVEPQNVPAIISLDTIVLNPMASIVLFRGGKQQVIARFNEEIGPIQFIHNVQNGYLFTLGMNLVYVGELDARIKSSPDSQPSWIDQLIKRLENEPVANPPASVTQYEYKGQTVYYVPQQYADIWSTLYDSDGQIIGHPDGGISGSGDGRIQDFLQERKNEHLIWTDKREYDPEQVKETAPIESVDILIAKSYPPLYSVRVISGLPNSCVVYGGYYLTHNGDIVRIEMVNWKPADPNTVCAEIYRTVEHDIPLGTVFESGRTYTVDLNDKIVTFTAQ